VRNFEVMAPVTEIGIFHCHGGLVFPPALLKNRIGPQDFKIRGHFTEMAESMEAFPASLIDLQIEVKLVFPRPASDRTGFDLGQVDVSESENRKSLK
jgi:hypothetical protein